MSETVKIGEMLVALSACPQEAIQEALHSQSFFGGRLGTNLLQMGAVEEARLADALARLYRIPSISGDVDIDGRTIALVPRRFVETYEVVPYAIDQRTLHLLVCDPRNVRAVDEIAFATGKRVELVVAAEARIWSLMGKYYRVERGARPLVLEARRWAPRVYPRVAFVQPVAEEVW